MSALYRTLAHTVVRAKERDHFFHRKNLSFSLWCCCVENSFECHSPFKKKDSRKKFAALRQVGRVAAAFRRAARGQRVAARRMYGGKYRSA